jgi:hypothetical protein
MEYTMADLHSMLEYLDAELKDQAPYFDARLISRRNNVAQAIANLERVRGDTGCNQEATPPQCATANN